MTINPSSKTISLRFFIFFIMLFFAPIFFRLIYMQLYLGGEYRKKADKNRFALTITKAVRGLIFDKNGQLLVKNIPNFQLILDSNKINRYQDNLFFDVSQITKISKEILENGFITSKKQGSEVILKNFIPYDDALTLMPALQNYKGFFLQASYSREYLSGEPFSHILGYLAPITAEEYKTSQSLNLADQLGKAGVEKNYEEILRGVNGFQRIEVNAQGVAQQIISQLPVEHGRNLTLTIDSALQKNLFQNIMNFVQKNNLSAGAAVAIDPRDGSVRALVSFPAYDNNLFSHGISVEHFKKISDNDLYPLFNRAISAEYPSGSIFKPIVAAAALEEKIITPYTEITSSGGITIDKYFFPDWKAGGHGVTNVTKGIAQSVNTFFYYIGGGDNNTSTGLGVERIVQYAKLFGLGTVTGIDLDNEQDGFLPSPEWKEEIKNEKWYVGDTYHLSIGQGDLLVTPLQMAIVTATIANGGTFYKPRIAAFSTSANGAWREESESVIINSQVVSKETIEVVRNGMRAAVLEGSAQLLQTLPVTAAAKTGTAQTSVKGKTHSWLTVFAPYTNPIIAMAIIIEEGGEGNDAALPITLQALTDYFENLNQQTLTE